MSTIAAFPISAAAPLSRSVSGSRSGSVSGSVVSARVSTADVRRAQRTRLRMTRRGRRVLTGLLSLPLVAVIAWGIVVGGGSALAAREGGGPATEFATVTVGAGDSLWSIAENVAPSADPRDVVYAIKKLNALGSSVVTVGDRLAIPVEYSQ